MERVRRFRPRLLERYVALEFLQIFLLALVAFVLLYLVVDFFERIDQLVRANLELTAMAHYVALKTPLALEQVISPAVLLAAVLSFGLLSRAHETMAIRSSGIDILGLLRPVLLLGLALGGCLVLLRFYLLPLSQGEANHFWETQVQKKPPRSLKDLAHFWYKGERTLYNILMYRKSDQTLEGVKIFRFDDQFRLIQVITARRAVWGEGGWRLYRGTVQDLAQPEGQPLEEFEEKELHVKETPADFASLERKLPELTLGELLGFIRRLERDGYKSTLYRLELQQRAALGLSPLILAALGAGLALRQENPFLPGVVAAGLACLFGYWLLLGFSLSLGQVGRWPVALAAWLPHLVFGSLALLILSQARR